MSLHMFTLFIFLIFSFIRLPRWLAIFQQKEYRLDRLLLFLRSSEGSREIARVLPRLNDFSKLGLKRPVRTNRVLFTASFSLVILIIAVWWVFNDSYYGIWLVVIYLFIPIIIVISNFPIEFIKIYKTKKIINQAKINLSKGNPIIIGITGSYGKTTTKQLLAHVLGQKLSVFSTPKSYNTKYSFPRSIVAGYTNQKIAILEYAAYTQGEISFLTKFFKPDIAIITGFTPQHIGLFGSVNKIIQAKSELIKSLSSKKLVFANFNDNEVKQMCQVGGVSTSKVNVYSGGNELENLSDIKLIDGRLSFIWKNRNVQTRLIGRHYLDAVKASIVLGKHFLLTDKEIINGLESFIPTESFIKIKNLKSGSILVNDGFSTNPKGFKAALDLLESFGSKKKVLLTRGIKDLGDVSNGIHSDLANYAKDKVDVVFYPGDTGRKQFEEVFLDKVINSEQEIIELMDSFGSKNVILLEGRLSNSLTYQLKKFYADI